MNPPCISCSSVCWEPSLAFHDVKKKKKKSLLRGTPAVYLLNDSSLSNSWALFLSLPLRKQKEKEGREKWALQASSGGMKNGSDHHWFFTVVTQRPGLQVHGEATGSNPSLQLMCSIQKLPCKSHPVPMNLSDKLKLPQQIMEKICSKHNAPVRLHKGITKRKGM